MLVRWYLLVFVPLEVPGHARLVLFQPHFSAAEQHLAHDPAVPVPLVPVYHQQPPDHLLREVVHRGFPVWVPRSRASNSASLTLCSALPSDGTTRELPSTNRMTLLFRAAARTWRQGQ